MLRTHFRFYRFDQIESAVDQHDRHLHRSADAQQLLHHLWLTRSPLADEEPHEVLVVAQTHAVRHPRTVVIEVPDASTSQPPHTPTSRRNDSGTNGGAWSCGRSGSTSRSPDDRGRDKCSLEAEFQREFQQREFQQRSLQMAGKKSRSDQKSYRLRHRRFWARHNEEWATPPLVSIPGVSPRWSSIDIEYSLVKLVCDPLACKKQQNDILILGHDYYR